MTISAEKLKSRIDAAMGRIPCDTVLRNARYLDVFSCEWRKGDLAIMDGVVVGLESGLRAAREVDLRGAHVVPGFIDAHVHLESSMMLPTAFDRAVLPKGTTTAICDPHEIANVVGTEGIRYFLESAEELHMDLRVMLSSCVPATHLETNGGGTITARQLVGLADHPRALGLAEMMNMPGVVNADPAVLAKLEAFSARPIDGHAPLLRGKELSAYAACGICSCHESSELEEGREKLQKGISVWIREGSVAKDLDALIPLLSMATSTSLGFCTDDRNPLDIAEQGHVDHLLRGALRAGIQQEVVYRAASWSVARHYGLTMGPDRVGAIAPGYRADLVTLTDPTTCGLGEVWVRGVPVRELKFESSKVSAEHLRGTVRAEVPDASALEGPTGRVRVIECEDGKIITGASVRAHDAPGVMKLSVLERYGGGSPPANGYVYGFGNLKGAIASSVGHDSHNLIAVGSRTDDMRAAMAELIRLGGGFCVVRDGKVLSSLALPYGGLMSDRSPEELKKGISALKDASRAIACTLPEPFLQLAFLSLPVIPSLKLTDKGLVDVNQFQIIPVAV